jgi:alpha,alpha-trehalase
MRIVITALSALAAATAATAAPPVATPADLFGPLFEAVQMRRIFPDGKTFVDAVPRRAPAAILAEYRRGRYPDDAALRRFVLANFRVPGDAPTPPAPTAATSGQRVPMAQHIAGLWPVLTRAPERPPAGSSALPLPAPYVVPGGRFREIYYWDSYFTMLGLVRDGRRDLVESMIDDFTSLIERHGHIPNGTRSYYLSRSQPPFFALMTALSVNRNPAVRARRLAALRREHAYWMAGAVKLAPGGAAARVVVMPDGAILNRYYDDRSTPRDESWREDVLAARASGRPAEVVQRDLRAGAESGWDFSSRWLGDGRTLATIRTTAVVPIDLNRLLWALERRLAVDCGAARDRACVRAFAARAQRRRVAIERWLWDARAGRYVDWDRSARRIIPATTAAMLYPLFVGLAPQDRADAIARLTARDLVASGGLRTTTVRTGQQWDRPNGWAPLQWVAVSGLRRYGQSALAGRIAGGWLHTVDAEYRASGRMLEKYDVEERKPGGGGEYALQDGFGWTNGVTRELLALYPGIVN